MIHHPYSFALFSLCITETLTTDGKIFPLYFMPKKHLKTQTTYPALNPSPPSQTP